MEIRYTIKDVMATDLITFKPDTPIESAIKSFLENKISGAPVVNEQGDLIGMLSEKDCLGTLFESSYYNNPSGYVKDYMSTELSTISIYDTLSEVAQKFLDLRFRRFPVLENGKLVGQISRRDVLKAVNNLSED
ncbi:MAG: CBS domain-containing protein [Candidatus Marinimicrobia bacterium]|nr:CBS domain-containing protein [Candidatus Neomarinimicrobiota bacterium]|tara:strand:+ start:1407 stop:1808 length:402 start_codon:yes stop_codon:yes gene_type:complete